LADGTKASHEKIYEFATDGKTMHVKGDVIVVGEMVDPLHDVYRRVRE
jgi:hypothetical protein